MSALLNIKKLTVVALAGAIVAACSASPVEEAVSSDEPIINGTNETAEGSGNVLLSVGCSGTLVANQWVLTAKHCLAGQTASAITVTMGSQSTTGSEIDTNANVDVGLLKLTAPMTMNGSTYAYHRAFYNASDADLVNSTVACHGYGRNTVLTGYGTLRTANLKVSSSDANGYTLVPNASGQITWRGDSGGSCFTAAGAITGVQSTCQCVPKPNVSCFDKSGNWIDANVQSVPSCYQVGSSSIRDWAQSVMEPVPGAFNAVWRPSTSAEIQVYGWKYQDFKGKYDALWPQGWRLHLLQPYVANGEVLYNATWRPGNGGEIQLYGATYAAFKGQYDQLWTEGWRLEILQPYVFNGQVYYSAVWTPGTEAEIQVYGWTYTGFKAKYDQLWTQGWRLNLLQPYVLNGQVLYSATWRPSTTAEIQVYGWTYADFTAKYGQLWPQGWRLYALSPYSVNGTVYYSAVWRPGNGGEYQMYNVEYNDFRQRYDDLWKQGWRLEMMSAL